MASGLDPQILPFIKEGSAAAATPSTQRPRLVTPPVASLPTDESRWTTEQKLEALDPEFRAKIEKVLAQLQREGWQPVIIFSWRSAATQAKLKAQGRTQVSFSFHNAVNNDAQPAAQAVDVADRRYSWGTKIVGGKEVTDTEKTKQAAAFFKRMGALAEAEGIFWGGSTKAGFSQRPPWSTHGMSWDPGHLQKFHNNGLAAVRTASLTALKTKGLV